MLAYGYIFCMLKVPIPRFEGQGLPPKECPVAFRNNAALKVFPAEGAALSDVVMDALLHPFTEALGVKDLPALGMGARNAVSCDSFEAYAALVVGGISATAKVIEYRVVGEAV